MDINPDGYIFLTWSVIVIVLFIIGKYNWNRRWLYYYGSKLNGPPSWPLIGSNHIFLNGGLEGLLETMVKIIEEYPPVFKCWLGIHLFIVNSEPEEIPILLNTFLEKAPYYNYASNLLKNGLLTGPVRIWRGHRKIINSTFGKKNLNSFVGIFAKHSKHLIKDLSTKGEDEYVDVFFDVWKCTLNNACEALLDIDSTLVSGQEEFISSVMRGEEELMQKLFSIWFNVKFLWNPSTVDEKLQHFCTQAFSFSEKLIRMKKSSVTSTLDENDETNTKNQQFLNHLIRVNKKDETLFSDEDLLVETQTMLVTSSETTATVVCFVMMLLAMFQDVQEKVYEEQYSIFGETERDPTNEDIDNMFYLERVIKETMRLFPVAPIISRYVDKDFKLGSYMYLKGSSVVVPLIHLHRNPKLWKDPLRFDPDRFLPEQVKTRHPCAYIPFSSGVRNCVGLKYGMMSMKIMVSTLLRHYAITASNYKSIKDIKLDVFVVIKPKDGFKVKLKKKT